MRLFPLLKKEYVLGLDLGASSVKSALFKKTQDNLQLVKLKMAELTPEKQMFVALQEALSGINLKKAEVIATFNSAQAMVKRAVAPLMPRDELKEALGLEAKNYFPFPVTDSLVDFELIGATTENGVKKTELLVGACPNRIIKEHLDVLSRAGIRPVRMLHSSIALCAVIKAKGLAEGANVAALDIGKNFCELIIVRGNKLIFSRKIPLCGDDFTKALTTALFSGQGRLHLSYEEAERIKKTYGLPQEPRQELIDNKITPAQIISLLRPLAEKLSGEIERSFDFYRDEAGGARVDKLVLFGGGSLLKGLDKFLSESLAIEVEIFSSLDGIRAKEGLKELTAEINRAATAVGAGLSGASGINFLPPEIKQETKMAVEKAALKAASSALLTVLALLYVGFRIHLGNINKKISAGRYELSALNQQYGSPENWNVISGILRDAPYCEDVLKEISNVIIQGLRLEELRMQGKVCFLRGAITSSSNPEAALSVFIRHLEQGIFKNAKAVTIKDGQGVKEFEFQIECK